jgi:hypothetical protein
MVQRALRFALALTLLASIVVTPVLARAGALPEECSFQVQLERGNQPLLDSERACQQQYGQTATADEKALMAYRLSLAEQVDRGTVSRIQANFLFREYVRHLQAEADKRNDESRRAWDRTLQNLFPTSPPPPPPVNCTTAWIGGTAYTTCR